MSEASRLRDFGDFVGDQPGLVAVSQAVECEAWADWMGAFAEVAVDGGPEYAAVEGAAS